MTTVKELITNAAAGRAQFRVREIAEEVFAEIDPADYEAALKETLTAYIGVVLSGLRRPGVNGTTGTRSTTPIKQSMPTSWAQSETANYYELFEIEYAVDAEDNVHKRIGDMNYAELVFVAEGRLRAAAENEKIGRKLRQLANLLIENGADTPRDLPEEVKQKL